MQRYRRNGRQTRRQGAVPLQFNAYKIPLDEKPGEARHRRRAGGNMDFITWATSPWGSRFPSILRGTDLGRGHRRAAVHDRSRALRGHLCRPKKFAKNDSPAVVAAAFPSVPRHSLVARAFHWVMAISMFALLITAFLPKVGVKFDWVTYHWIAGLVLTASMIFSHLARVVLPGLLVDMAGQDRPARREEKAAAVRSAKMRRHPTGLPSIRWKTSFITL
jgi:hypothetical protein